jgi:hypothetical protein
VILLSLPFSNDGKGDEEDDEEDDNATFVMLFVESVALLSSSEEWDRVKIRWG